MRNDQVCNLQLLCSINDFDLDLSTAQTLIHFIGFASANLGSFSSDL